MIVWFRQVRGKENNVEVKGVKEYYNMHETRLKTVDSEEDLGIIFDKKLSFEEHINSKVKNANSLAGSLLYI